MNILYILLSMVILAAEFYYGKKASFSLLDFSLVGIFSVWLIFVGFYDLKTLRLPLWLTAPVMVAAVLWRFVDPTQYENPIFDVNLQPLFSSITGLCFGFLMCDLLTHFANWLLKFPRLTQGLLPLWIALPIMFANVFLPFYSLYWAIPLVLALRFIFTSKFFFKVTESLLKLPWLAYLLVFSILIGVALHQIRYSSFQVERLNLVIFPLCFAFIYEEVFIPLLAFIKKEKVEEENTPTFIGGGDASFVAAIGAFCGPIFIVNCLEISFVLAFLVVAVLKVLNKLKPDFKVAEMAFGPIIALTTQLIILLKTAGL